MTIDGIATEITEQELRNQVTLLGGNPDDRSQICVAAFLVDNAFRENVTRFYFDRALEMVAYGAKK